VLLTENGDQTMNAKYSLWFVASALWATAGEACFVETRAMTPFGESLDAYRISSVRIEGVSILSTEPNRFGAEILSEQGRIIFSKAVSLPLKVAIEMRNAQRPTGLHGSSIRGVFTVTTCPQKIEVLDGTQLNVTGWAVFTTGRVTGCRFDGNWWVRAIAMFGSFPDVPLAGGHIEGDGSFKLMLGGRQRYILTVGKDRDPVRTVAVDVKRDLSADVGEIDLAGLCPSK